MKIERNFFSKIKVKNYEQKLEYILEKKKFSETIQNLLLNMFYKIDANYNDYIKLKRYVKPKIEFLEELINNIDIYCEKIEIVKQTDIKDNELVINREEGFIQTYLNEDITFRQLELLFNIDYKTNEEYGYDGLAIRNFLKKARAICLEEIIKSFTGYSWTYKSVRKEDIIYFSTYQSLQIILGFEFFDEWEKNTTNENDYIDIMISKLIAILGEEDGKKLYNYVLGIALNKEIETNKKLKEILKKELIKTEEELSKYLDITKYSKKMSKEKKEKSEAIKKLDLIINSPKLLELELEKENSKNPEVFITLKNFKTLIKKNRDKVHFEIKEINKSLIPANYIEKRNNLEEIKNNIKFSLEDNYKLLVKFQKFVTKFLQIKISKIKLKKTLKDYLYMIRYYLKLPFVENDKVIIMAKVADIELNVVELERLLIVRLYKEKQLYTFTSNTALNIEISRSIFKLNTISLENISCMFDLDEALLVIKLFDGESLELTTTLPNSVETYADIHKIGSKKHKNTKFFI